MSDETGKMDPEEAATKAKRALLWMITILAAFAMTAAGATKFTSPEVWDEGFIAWGYGLGLKNLVGVLEIVGGLALLVPKLASYAAIIVCVIMAGAVYTLMTNPGEMPLVPAASQFVMFAIVGFARWGDRWTPGG